MLDRPDILGDQGPPDTRNPRNEKTILHGGGSPRGSGRIQVPSSPPWYSVTFNCTMKLVTKLTKPKIHVALLGNQKTIEHLVIRRRIDELIIVHSHNKLELAQNLVERYKELGIIVEPVLVISTDFNNVLSLILSALDHRKFDDYQIEFSINSEHCIMTLAACVAAAIVKASVLCTTGNETVKISEVWPSELVNLTHKKREILEYLETYGCPITQIELSKETGIRQSGVSRYVRDLELAGYVSRDRNARVKQVQITELGVAILHHKQIRKRRLWSPYTSRASEGIQTVG
jgi:DNA-binding MarR family transcriptional regulator